MSKQRRTADDFVRDMKAKQQHSTSGDIERKTSEGGPVEQQDACATTTAGNSLTFISKVSPAGAQANPKLTRGRVGGIDIARGQLNKKVNDTSEQNTASCYEQKFESISGDEGHNSLRL
jgi:hypothetical protein